MLRCLQSACHCQVRYCCHPSRLVALTLLQRLHYIGGIILMTISHMISASGRPANACLRCHVIWRKVQEKNFTVLHGIIRAFCAGHSSVCMKCCSCLFPVDDAQLKRCFECGLLLHRCHCWDGQDAASRAAMQSMSVQCSEAAQQVC